MTNERECKRCGASYDVRSRGCEQCGPVARTPAIELTVQQAMAPIRAEPVDVLYMREQLAQPFRIRPEGWMLL